MVTKRASEITPFIVMDIFEKAHIGAPPGIDFGKTVKAISGFHMQP